MKKFAALVILLTVYGCSDAVFSDTMTFPENRWPRTQAPAFDVQITDAGTYDIYVELSHVYGGIPMASVPMNLTVEGPKTNAFDFDLAVIRDGEHVGDCTGDYCDLEAKIATMELTPGKYDIAVAQSFDHEFLPNIIRTGITVKKAQ